MQKDDLKYILDSMVSLQKFAESKNGALLTFMTAVLAATLNVRDKVSFEYLKLTNNLLVATVIVLIILLMSFVPLLSGLFYQYVILSLNQLFNRILNKKLLALEN